MMDLSSLVNMSSVAYGPQILAGIYILAIVIFVIKGFALFKAAQRREKVWFWVMLATSTLGILEVYYLYSRRNK